MKIILTICCIALLAGCTDVSNAPPPKQVNVRIAVPSTNSYPILKPMRVGTDVFGRGHRPYGHHETRPIVEYSLDGTNFSAFPVVTRNTFSNVMGVHELDVSPPGKLWIRTGTTNQSDVGKTILISFNHKRR